MEAEQKVGAVQLSTRLRGVSPPVTRRLRVTEQTSLAELHAALQVAFGWNDGHLYTFQIRGWQFGDPARAIEPGARRWRCRYWPPRAITVESTELAI